MVLSWTEREDRIERDDGDLGDAVFLLANSTTTAYHDVRDCSGLSRRADAPVDERTRGDAQADLRPPCRVCVLPSDEFEIDHRDPAERFSDLIKSDRDRRQRERESWPDA